MQAELSKSARFERVLSPSKGRIIENLEPGFTKEQIKIVRAASGVISEPNIRLRDIRDYLNNEED